ncbi:hypothetical protein GR183_03040 [Stappia sp. GBMRC 2046]|uniref:Uncharacterized protein n=1 Tax=Stappia sediminis TaxID=2692190 RepID=A0A7X3S6D5_9HYPH|nr:hypothetical protein [Stappia sediminis]MXN63868.1 hypothetical protein [Stappia sediminis]
MFQIINYASKAFAMYYCLQAVIAAILTRKEGVSFRFAFYSCLSLVSLAIVIFGTSVENGTD